MNKTLERELEKCIWLLKAERLRLGANELTERHRSNVTQLVNELQTNCREYAKLDGGGSSDRRKAAVRYARLFQKAVDDYVVTTEITKPVSDYLDALERLQTSMIEVLRLQQRRKYALPNAEPTPCGCFAEDKTKAEALAAVAEEAERQKLRKSKETQTECGIASKGIQAQTETTEHSMQTFVDHKSVGTGDSILINDLPHQSSSTTSAEQSVSVENSLGDLLQQFRKVMRDEPTSPHAVPLVESNSARFRFDKLHRILDESGLSGLSDMDNSERQ